MAQINSKVLHDTLKSALACASTDASRPHLSGVNFVTEGPDTAVVATDGHCLVTILTPWALPKGEVLLPRESVEAAIRLLSAWAKPKTSRPVEFDGRSLNGMALATSDERFPLYKRVIPEPCETPTKRVGLNVHLLAKAAKEIGRAHV